MTDKEQEAWLFLAGMVYIVVEMLIVKGLWI